MLADAAGVTVWRWDNLEPFGLTGVQTDPDGNGQAFVFNLRFAGQYFDAESGLFHNRHRDYDSASGRYVQADPIGLAGGISLYSYVGANPLGFVDPLGLARCGVKEGEAGRFGDLEKRSVTGDNLEPHHMPQAAMKYTSREDGGALMMTHEEHAATRTYAGRGRVAARQDAGSAFRDVLAKDIRDVRGISGSKYNKGLNNLTNYYRESFPDLMSK